MTVLHDFLIGTLAAAATISVLTLVAILIRFSLRKKRPQPQAVPEAALAPEAIEGEQAVPAEGVALGAPEFKEPEASQVSEVPQPYLKPEVSEPREAAIAVELPRPEIAAPVGEMDKPAPSVARAAQPPKAPAASAAPGLGLRRTRENFLGRLRAAVTGRARVDEIYEGLEEALIAADVGVEASMKLVDAVRARLKNNANADTIREILKGEVARMLAASERPMADSGDAPLVVMLVGVNGVGKTTTVAKLAARMKAERGSVLVGAADTFRAAAIEQLQVWCDRVGVDLIKQKQGSDPAAVAFDTVKAAVARKVPTVLIDTAGRLQTKVNLMEELKKVARVIGREVPGAPHETWLVLDATTGQNALSQAKLFADAVPLTGVVLAKLDSTAKGGVIIAIAERLKLPVRFVGVGEGVEDLRTFDAQEFAEALFAEEQSEQVSSGSYAA